LNLSFPAQASRRAVEYLSLFKRSGSYSSSATAFNTYGRARVSVAGTAEWACGAHRSWRTKAHFDDAAAPKFPAHEATVDAPRGSDARFATLSFFVMRRDDVVAYAVVNVADLEKRPSPTWLRLSRGSAAAKRSRAAGALKVAVLASPAWALDAAPAPTRDSSTQTRREPDDDAGPNPETVDFLMKADYGAALDLRAKSPGAIVRDLLSLRRSLSAPASPEAARPPPEAGAPARAAAAPAEPAALEPAALEPAALEPAALEPAALEPAARAAPPRAAAAPPAAVAVAAARRVEAPAAAVPPHLEAPSLAGDTSDSDDGGDDEAPPPDGDDEEAPPPDDDGDDEEAPPPDDGWSDGPEDETDDDAAASASSSSASSAASPPPRALEAWDAPRRLDAAGAAPGRPASPPQSPRSLAAPTWVPDGGSPPPSPPASPRMAAPASLAAPAWTPAAGPGAAAPADRPGAPSLAAPRWSPGSPPRAMSVALLAASSPDRRAPRRAPKKATAGRAPPPRPRVPSPKRRARQKGAGALASHMIC